MEAKPQLHHATGHYHEQINQACSGPLFQAFAKGRLALDSTAQPLEIKHEIRQPLGWRTRGSAKLKAGDDPSNGIVLQKGGVKTPERMSIEEQNEYMIKLFLDRTPKDTIEYSVGIGLKDIVRKNADFVHRAVIKKLSMEFDWKRLPIAACEHSVQFGDALHTHLSFSTAPHPDVQSFQRMREAWEERWLGSSEQPRAIAKWSVCRFHAAARSGWLK